MKKFLLFLFSVFLSSPAYAVTIDLPSYQSGNDVTISNLNTTNTTIENWANGGVEGGVNIKAGSIVSQDMAASVSPVTRWDEAFSDFTYTGMLPTTSADLTSTISAGTSYVAGYRVVKNAEAHTYTASKDTYVYLNKGGYYVYSEVANGAAAPSTPTPTADHLLLAKVVTSGSAITSVTDLRTTSIQLTVSSTVFPMDYRSGAFVSRDSTTAFHMEPGNLAIGTSIYQRTADTSSKTISTAANWIEGSAPNLSAQLFYIYAYNESGTSYDFKYSSADPVYSDTSSNTGGTLRYYTTGGVTYRAVAWAYASGDAVQTYEYSNFPDMGFENKVFYQTGAVATGTTTVGADDTTFTSSEGNQYMQVRFKPTNVNSTYEVEACGLFSNSSTSQIILGLFRDSDSTAFAIGSDVEDNTVSQPTTACVKYDLQGLPTTSLTTIKLRAGGSSATTTTFNGVGGVRRYGGNANSYIKVKEKP